MISTRGSSVWLLITAVFELILAGFFLFLGLLIPEVMFGFTLTAIFLGLVAVGLIFWGVRWRGREQEARRITATGHEGRATVTGLKQTGMWINNNPVVSMDLMVEVPGRPPYPVTLSETVPQILLARLTSGMPLTVKVDRADPTKVVVDWSLPGPMFAPGPPLMGQGIPFGPPMGMPYAPPPPPQAPAPPPQMPAPYQPPQPPPVPEPVVPGPPEEARVAGLHTADDIAEHARRQLAASRLRAVGRRAVATVVDVADTGRLVEGERVFSLTLNVRPEYGDPYRITHETPVPAAELPGLTEGAPLPVRVDPGDQTQLAMDWHRVD